MREARYNSLADEYAAFIDEQSPYYLIAADALALLIGDGPGRCLDIGCGGGQFVPVAERLGWTVTGVDESRRQLEQARARLPRTELVEADAGALPFDDDSFDAAYSTFTHTDFDDFAGAIREARRVLRRGGVLVYVGNHPAFVGATQEHPASGPPRLHPGYRRVGRFDAAEAPGAASTGWRARLGSFVHLPLGPFLSAFAGLTLAAALELDDGFEYPKTIALSWTKP